ncbi:MAG TPA: lipopolysaccharide kinase InaA family protein, partial [Thermoanaerobaculia bacterium]|nr:lipopolysaccharide kinase InaA family protein [Thermoanaerobaculia bacterium]
MPAGIRPPIDPPQDLPIELPGWRGQIAADLRPADLAAAVARLTDPGAAIRTLHWGRNYLYAARLDAPGGPLEVVVKQFREESWRDRRARRRRGSKAERSFRAARAVLAAGVATPEPILWLAPAGPAGSAGPSFYACRPAEGIEARYLFRAAAAGKEREEFPDLELTAVLAELGRLARKLHDAGIRHRDLSVGNVLIRPGEPPALALLDLDRARLGVRLGRAARIRELSRLALFRSEDRERLLAGYFGRPPSALERGLLAAAQGAFEAKNRGKGALRAVRSGLFAAFRPRRAHPHIPPPPAAAETRDKIVWDRLSDQPHQHAGRLEKLAVRLGDAPAHLREAAAWLAAAPRIRRRFAELRRELFRGPLPFDGLGVGLRPLPEDPEGLLGLIDDLGCRRILLRLHPWDDDHDAEEELARALAGMGCDLLFALPQNRDLVRDPARWRAALEEIRERFLPYGRRFQIGQAINRSKWGVWTLREYVELARIAGEVLRGRSPGAPGSPNSPGPPGVELLGPAVIDFELHATAAVLNLRAEGLRFDAVGSLLYVDRRGAPENRQLGLDATGKLRLLRAIAETAKNARGRSWITEVNWPLREGPHSPAGRSVSVDEETQASYLAR